MTMSIEYPVGVELFELDDVVRVRCEPMLSVVVAPAHRRCELPEDVPDLNGVCCVPLALVRTPADDPKGLLRWVGPRDLARAETD
jgi:hypothetical protein